MAPPGIGAAGILGIAREVLLPPVQSALATATTGGTITAGTYRYVVTAINASGETTASNEQTITTTGATSTVTVTWVAVTGATGYKLYKTAAGGGTGTELLYKTVGLVTTDVDTTPGTPTGAFPSTNTASNSGVYVAPTKFIPFMSESLTSTQATIWRRPIRQSADIIGAVPGNFNVAGDISIEGMEDCVVYFLFGSRMSIAKTGTTNYTYTCTPTANAIPNNTLSITVVRNGTVFGFTGCVVTSQTFTQNDGIFMYNLSIIGRDEAAQTLPTPTWPTTVPFGAGQWSIEIPTGTPVFDTDTFEFTIDDGADPQFRLKSTTRGADFIKYGERALTMTMERDFLDRTDFDAFKALTSQTITITASKGANNSISLNAPAAIKDTYEVTNSGQGDLVRASLAYNGVIDGTGKSYQITLKTQENVL
jgi:hypothetical protein